MKKACVFLALLCLAASQFTSFVPQYTMGLPEEPAQYGSYPYINSFDPYLTTIKSSQPTVQPAAPAPIIQTAPFATRQGCSAPLENIGGVCRCPNNGILLTGICFPRDTSGPTIVCRPPRVATSEGCVCPNNQVYTSAGTCVSSFTPSIPTQLPTTTQTGSQTSFSFGSNLNPTTNTGNVGDIACPLPRTIVNGRCQCPNGAIFLSGKCYNRDNSQYPTEPILNVTNPNSIEALSGIFRSYDGTDNNLAFPKWGSKGETLERRGINDFKDGLSVPRDDLPNPRYISNTAGSLQGSIRRSRNRVTMAFVIWGQFLDHDLDLTEAGSDEKLNIQIPSGDAFFNSSTNRVLSFSRSHHKPSAPFTVRQFPNDITAWIDGSQVYGSNETQARYLRRFADGKLRISRGSENLLPTQSNSFGSLFEAGDVRVNENVLLISYHTTFVREHNRMCDILKQRNPNMNDEMLYQASRLWVIGLLQKISVQDFLPILIGSKYDEIVGPYRGYRSNLNPNIPVEFSTAAFRIGHSLLVDQHPMIDRFNDPYQTFTLGEVFFKPDFITSNRIADVFRGLSKNLMKEKSEEVIDSVRNLLVLDPLRRQVKLDLFSLNLQRARDHGLCSYNDARVAFGLSRVTQFEQIIREPAKASKLRAAYFNRINDVELFPGIIAEDPVEGGVLGELGATIVGQTFRNLRDADRLWYESAYPPSVVNEIKQTTFSDIIARNNGVDSLSRDIFHLS